jgi:UDP-N-acetylglucosamine:LPS N-acetylglucosamine transferase
VLGLLDRPERLQAMAEASAALARPDAADNIADELVRLASGVRKQ